MNTWILLAAVVMCGLAGLASIVFLGLMGLAEKPAPAALGAIAGTLVGALAGLVAHPSNWLKEAKETDEKKDEPKK